ncbi:MAG: outer membrane protein transport protein [Gammaproteobacteria bacterium]|nr:outer membrane protein transport protein [Gammaproteobacteria bacterium]
MKIKNILPAVATASLLMASAQSIASGFAIIENSASGMGNAYAGGAGAEDASTIWFNPAGMTYLDNEMLAAGHIIMPTAEYIDTGSTTAAIMGATTLDPANTDRTADGGKNALIPNLYWVKEIQKDLKMGLGITVPFGLGTDYDDDWVGRYHGVKSDVMSLNLNPSIAYKKGNASFGFGLNAQYIKVELTSAIDMGTLCAALGFPPSTCTPQGNDGFAELDGDSWAYGYNFGVLFDVTSDIRLGASHRSSIDHDVTGNADFTVPGALSFLTSTGSFLDTTLSASVSVPATTSISYFQNVNEKISIMADYSITTWSDFQELRIAYDDPNSTDGLPAQDDSVTTQEWEDTARIAFGMNYKASAKWLYRFGIALDQSPVPSAERRTARIPGNDRTWLTFGVTHQFDKERSFSFAYAHLTVDDTPINNTFEASTPVLEHTLSGEYQASVDIISAQVSWKY